MDTTRKHGFHGEFLKALLAAQAVHKLLAAQSVTTGQKNATNIKN
jgi:hypothetical protein